MVINRDESQRRTIVFEQFLGASAEVAVTAHGDDVERYAHISRAQLTRLVKQWHGNRLASVPLVKRYRAPAAPFARKYTALDIELLVEMDKAHEDCLRASRHPPPETGLL